MVTLTIDHQQVQIPEGTSILEAAASIGIDIPHLCYIENVRVLPDISYNHKYI